MRQVVHILLSAALATTIVCDPACAATDGLVTSVTSSDAPALTHDEPLGHTAAWPFFNSHRRPSFDFRAQQATPHPAVARIVVPEKSATAYGSGTLVDVRDQYGLVVTNWHVVCDS